MNSIEDLKVVLRESSSPFFSDEELQFYLKKNKGDFKATAYECLVLKSEDTSLVLSGFTSASTERYFKRLAVKYKPSNSGILGG